MGTKPRKLSTISARTMAFVAVLMLLPATWAEGQNTSVSVDVTQLDENTYERIDALNLENKVIVRLVQEGFAVVATSEDPHIRVAYLAGARLRIEVQTEKVALDRLVDISSDVDLDALHLEVSQKTVELVRQMPPATSTKAAIGITPASVPAEVVTNQPEPPPRRPLVLDAMAGFVYRGESDPQIGLALAYPLTSSMAITGGIHLIPASSSAIDVFEWQAQAGLSWTALVTIPWRLGVGISAGLLVHHFSLPNDSGTRVNALVTIPLSLSRTLRNGLTLGGRLAPGFTPESREHTAGDQQLWQRSGARLEVLGQLTWHI